MAFESSSKYLENSGFSSADLMKCAAISAGVFSILPVAAIFWSARYCFSVIDTENLRVGFPEFDGSLSIGLMLLSIKWASI